MSKIKIPEDATWCVIDNKVHNIHVVAIDEHEVDKLNYIKQKSIGEIKRHSMFEDLLGRLHVTFTARLLDDDYIWYLMKYTD